MAYPIFVNLDGRRCVIVGAGRVAERRVDAVLRERAHVRVVAPQASPSIRSLAQYGKISWMASLYSSEHLEGAFLVVAATNDAEINATVCRDAIARNILVSCADRPDAGSFITAAIVDRGELTIALTTGGKSPTLTSVLRERIEEQYGPEWSAWTQLFGQLRSQIQQLPTEAARRHAVSAILESPAAAAHIAVADIAEAAKEAERCISLLPA